MRKVYLYAYLKSFVFYFVWSFIGLNLVRLLNFGLNCLTDCDTYDPNPLTLLKVIYSVFFIALIAGTHGIVQVYETLHPPQKKFNRGDEGSNVLSVDDKTTDDKAVHSESKGN